MAWENSRVVYAVDQLDANPYILAMELQRRVPVQEQPHYSTWIRMSKIVTFWLLAVVFLASGFVSLLNIWFLLSFVPGFIFTYIAVIVTLTHWRFSSSGGDYQRKIHELLLSHKSVVGETLDIGCGNGSLLIKAAMADRSAHHIGMDFWGSDWEYSMQQCQANSKLEGANNVEFQKGTASKTEFLDRRFACVLSCLTFHEVRDESNKLNMVKEALRVLRYGGCYAFLDLFGDTKYYPSNDEVRAVIEQSGCIVSLDKPLAELIALPFPLNGKRALGFARLLCGTKISVS